MKCPRCGFEHNKVNETHCYWCGELLEWRQKNSLGYLKQRLEALQLEFHKWCIDLGEFCIDRKFDLKAKQIVVTDFALWLDGIARKTIPLAEICKNTISVIPPEFNNSGKRAKKNDHLDREGKKRLYSRFYWGWVSGVWTVLVIEFLIIRFFM